MIKIITGIVQLANLFGDQETEAAKATFSDDANRRLAESARNEFYSKVQNAPTLAEVEKASSSFCPLFDLLIHSE